MRLLVAPIACVVVLMAGCASVTPPAAPPRTTSTPPAPAPARAPAPAVAPAVANANATHEYRSSVSPQQRASVWASDPATIIHAFATAYINWNAGNVAARMRALAAASIGQARSAMQLAAANTSRDYELQRGGIANSGTVEAIAPLQGARDRYVVVTQEQTTATNTSAYQGLRPAWHLTIATVQQMRPGAWVVSGWQPET